jgi:hypothetical protein
MIILKHTLHTVFYPKQIPGAKILGRRIRLLHRYTARDIEGKCMQKRCGSSTLVRVSCITKHPSIPLSGDKEWRVFPRSFFLTTMMVRHISAYVEPMKNLNLTGVDVVVREQGAGGV